MNTPPITLYWHDYETFGPDPSKDRPAQFAGLRTDLDLNPIGEPLLIYCKPASDLLPQPEACLITGITPQLAHQKGVIEAEFIQQIHAQFTQPGTCGVGYNSIRFDDEVTRYTLYRNFYDPYAREYQNNNARWDIIDMIRTCYALRPEGIEWPEHEPGIPSFKLEDLTVANGLTHDSAHDALSDVQATIALAKLVKSKQPKLYDYAFSLRSKQVALQLLNVSTMQPLVHTSSMFPSNQGCTSIVAPIALHPVNRNGVIVYDLRHDPSELLAASADEIHERLYKRTSDLPEGMQRFHIKTVHINKSPMLAPLNTITADAEKRLQLDMDQVNKHLAQLKAVDDLAKRVQQALQKSTFPAADDPEQNLYGGFFKDEDRKRINQVRQSSAEQLTKQSFSFDDPRLAELLFRYRARNWPQSLSEAELESWNVFRTQQLSGPDSTASITLPQFEEKLQQLASGDLNEKQMQILEDLAEYSAMFI